MSMATDLKKGSAFEYKGEVLKVTRKEVIAVGTHSHTKLKLYVRPLFGGGEKNMVLAHNDKVEIVEAGKKTATLVAKLPNNKVQIMDMHSYETLDADVDEELISELNEGDNVIFVDYKGRVLVFEKGRPQTE